MARSLDDYLSRVTSEHNQQPDFIATLSAVLQPLCDLQTVVEHLPFDFDLDLAIGVQLDAVGVRVNRDRFVSLPLNVYFSVGVAGLGVGQGYLKNANDPLTGLTTLPDEPYRIVLRAVIAANFWDGTIPGAYAAYDTLFANTGLSVLISDYGDDSMSIALVGVSPDAINLALFSNGELDLKPAGVELYRLLPAIYPAAVPGGTPLFGVGVENNAIAGVGVGQLAQVISTE